MDVDNSLLNAETDCSEKDDFCQKQPVEAEIETIETVTVSGEDIVPLKCKLCTFNVASSSERLLHGSLTPATDDVNNTEFGLNTGYELTSSIGTECTLHDCSLGKDNLRTEVAVNQSGDTLQTVSLLSSRSESSCLRRNVAAALCNSTLSNNSSSLTRFSDNRGEGEYEKYPLADGRADYSERHPSLCNVDNFQSNVVAVEVHGSTEENKFCSVVMAGNNQSPTDSVEQHMGVSFLTNDRHFCSKLAHDEGALNRQEHLHGLHMDSSNFYFCQELCSDDKTVHSMKPDSSGSISDAAVNSDNSALVQRCDADIGPMFRNSSMLERCGSGGSIERFLAPSLPVSKGVITPVDDPGFAKVPGYTSELPVMEEEEVYDVYESENTDQNTELSNITSSICHRVNKTLNVANDSEQEIMRAESTGARSRTSRPNSLLGLSKPCVNLSASCREVQQKNIRIEADAPPFLNVTRVVAETDTMSGLLRPRQRPVLSMISSEKARPNSLSLSQRPLSWSSAPALHPPSSTTSKRPCSLNLRIGVSPETVLQNNGPTETKCRRRTSRSGVQAGLPVESEVLPSPSAARVPIIQAPDNEQSTGSHLSSPPAQVSVTSVGYRDQTSCGTEAVRSSEQTGLQSNLALPSAQHHAEVLSIFSATEGSTPLTSNASVSIFELGKVAPIWVPDSSAPRCMHCDCRFTFTRRRHHCRACGKVFCSTCCNVKAKLRYLGNKEARVCSQCHVDLLRANLLHRVGTHRSQTVPSTPLSFGSPARDLTPQSMVSAVPVIEVFNSASEAGRQTSPDIAPVTESNDDSTARSNDQQSRVLSQRTDDNVRTGQLKHSVVSRRAAGTSAEQPQRTAVKADSETLAAADRLPSRTVETASSLDLNRSASPAVFTGSSLERSSLQHPVKLNGISHAGKSADTCSGASPLQVELGANLFVYISLVKLECCVHRKCWCFTTRGLCTVGQDEVVIVLEQLPQEDNIPSDVLVHILSLYNRAAQGKIVCDLDYVVFEDGLCGRQENAGFLYCRPSYQCLQGFTTPQTPFLLAVLILQSEVMWAQTLPLRLLLRLGSEYRYYPCPLVSVRGRKPVCKELGHTVMTLLGGGHRRLPRVAGLHVFMENKITIVTVPLSSRNEMISALDNCSNNHTIAIEADFSEEFDSYLVAVQSRDSRCHTQAIKIDGQTRCKTGASFIVFSVSVNETVTSHAHCSIVEDGILIQLSRCSFDALHTALSSGDNFSITDTESTDGGQQLVVLRWIDNTTSFGLTESLVIDSSSLTNARRHRVCYEAADRPSRNSSSAKHLLFLRCTDVYHVTDNTSLSISASKFHRSVAQLFCSVFNSSLDQFILQPATPLRLKVSLHQTTVECDLHVGDSRCDSDCVREFESRLRTLLRGVLGQNDCVSVMLFVFYVVREAD